MKRFTLEQIAQFGLDAYLRAYQSTADFFNMVHFKVLVCSTYATVMNDKYQDQKTRIKQDSGFSFVEMSGPWFVKDEIKVCKDDVKDVHYIELPQPNFVFEYDSLCSSVHSIVKTGKKQCGEFIRISNADYWKIPSVPVTNDIFWYQLGERIEFPISIGMPEKVLVNYIPALLLNSDKCSIPETMVDAIVTTVLQIMFGAKNETMVVDKSDDGNPNVNATSEMAPANQ